MSYFGNPCFVEPDERTTDVTYAINRLLDQGGIPAVTMRAIAGRVHMGLGTLCGHLYNRRTMLDLCGQRFARHRLGTLERLLEWHDDGLRAFLPPDEDDIWRTRAWLGWRELARNHRALEVTIVQTDDRERALLRQAAPGLDDAAIDVLWAVVQHLREQVSWPHHGMGLLQAQRMLEGTAAALSRSAVTTESGSSAE